MQIKISPVIPGFITKPFHEHARQENTVIYGLPEYGKAEYGRIADLVTLSTVLKHVYSIHHSVE